MRLVRSILSALLIACLIATPAVAKTAAGRAHAPPPASVDHAHKTHKAAVPDCHGMAHKSGEPSRAGEREHRPGASACPHCDQDKSCSADVCQLKCFKVLGALAERAGGADIEGGRYVTPAQPARAPVSLKPKTPPPRS